MPHTLVKGVPVVPIQSPAPDRNPAPAVPTNRMDLRAAGDNPFEDIIKGAVADIEAARSRGTGSQSKESLSFVVGNAVRIADRLLLTASHLLPVDDYVKVDLGDTTFLKANYAGPGCLSEYHLALVELPYFSDRRGLAPPARVGNLRTGQAVFLKAYHPVDNGNRRNYWQLSGKIGRDQIAPHGTSRPLHSLHLDEASLPSLVGMSGGGVFDEDGNLVGIMCYESLNYPGKVAYIASLETWLSLQGEQSSPDDLPPSSPQPSLTRGPVSRPDGTSQGSADPGESRQGVRPRERDVAMDSSEKRKLLEALVVRYREKFEAELLLIEAGFPLHLVPPFGHPLEFWGAVCRMIADGTPPGRLEALLEVAAKQYPHAEVLKPYRRNDDCPRA